MSLPKTIITLLLFGPSLARIWISKVEPIARESLDVQALVVKDEEVAAVGCKAATRNDVRNSNKRYLMCAGSILTSRYVLTSASCIHEATHIRHNIRAPLAVMIAPFSEAAQVIKIASYSVHPGHVVDPRDEHHTLHNIAVVKLVCRILKRNLHAIILPTQPFIDQCAEDSCKVAVTKETGPMSFIMYEVPANDISVVRAKRDQVAVAKIKSPDRTANESRFNDHDIKKVSESDENGAGDARIIETAKRANNESSKYLNEKHFNIRKNITTNKFNRSPNSHHNSNRKLFTRENHGIKGCPLTGAPVMSNSIQSAMVTVSCDDRQPETPWKYTDLFDNLDWINEMMGNWKPTPTLAGGGGGGGCITCIYNYFIDYNNCTNRADCPKNLLPELVKCTRNHADSKIPFVNNLSDIRTTEPGNRAYIDAIRNLYLNKHDHADETNDNEKNSYAPLVRQLSSQQPPNPASERTLAAPNYRDNCDQRDANYRKVKATYDNDYKADGNEPPARENRDYEPRYNRIKKLDGATSTVGKSVENLYADDNRERDLIPRELTGLYEKFLEEQRLSREKVNKNVVRRA